MFGNWTGLATRLTVVGAYLRLTITDTPSDAPIGQFTAVAVTRATRTIWFHLPADWVVDGGLLPCRRKFLLDGLYPPGPASSGGGQRPADRYVVLDVQERLLSETEARSRPWLCDRAAFRRYRADGSSRAVTPAEL